MLRGQRAVRQFARGVYISPHSTSDNGPKRLYRRPDPEYLESKQEAALLDSQLKELKRKQGVLREQLAKSRDEELQQKLARLEGVLLSKTASPTEIAALEAQLALPQLQTHSSKPLSSSTKQIRRIKLPKSIQELLPSNSHEPSLQLFAQAAGTDWAQLITQLPVLPSNIRTSDVEQLVVAIPAKIRSKLVDKLETIIPKSAQSQFVKDQLMAAYAEASSVQNVERLIRTCSHPTVFSFSHWAKALFKVGSKPEAVLSVIKEMDNHGLEATLPIMSTALQSYIQHGRHVEAETLFDNMKYWSVSMMPDLKIYNSMILSAAKQYNINRCLDLFSEMKQRRPYPLQPNQETYNYMVYACVRDPKTHIMAWDLFMEAQALGFTADRQTFKALLYLCGSSGETLLARALVRNLSERSPQFVDQYTLNCLFLAYRHWTPEPSRILTSPSGQAIRKNILMSSSGGITGSQSTSAPPLLPLAKLTDQLVLLESNAVFEYYADVNPGILVCENKVSTEGSPALHNFLTIAINLGSNITEFKRRFNRFTKFVTEKDAKLLLPENSEPQEEPQQSTYDQSPLSDLPRGRHSKFALNRNHFIYRLAMQAATKFKDLEFGRLIWTERGQWRRTNAFRNLSQEERNASDFQFARDLVELLSVCGHIEEAILLVKSTRNLRKWRKHHLVSLISACERVEDSSAVSEIMKIVRSPQ